MNFSEILTFVRQRIKKLPESPFPHTYIYISLLMVKKMEKSQLKKYFKIKPQLKKSR
jgi:hypothetical protein